MAIPSTPTGLALLVIGNRGIRATWGDVAGEIGYLLQWSLDGTAWVPLPALGADVVSFDHHGLEQNTEYYYRIAAYNGEGASSFSASVSATTFEISPPAVEVTPAQRLYVHAPTVIFAARVNLVLAIYPLTSLKFDGVTVGSYDLIQPDMTLLLGSSAGADDYGRVRVQGLATATTIPIGRVSQGVEDGSLDVVDNAYITIFGDDWRVWAKIPYISPAGVAYKDGNVEVGDYLDNPPPICNVGPGVGDTIDDVTGVITVAFDASASVAMADGATIDVYAWDLQGGVVTAGALDAATVTATFTAGFRMISCTITDSNGKQHTARASIVARDPDDDLCVQNWEPRQRIQSRTGQQVAFDILDNLPRPIYPDGTLVVWWEDGRVDAADRTNMKFIGWEMAGSMNIKADEYHLYRGLIMECADVGGRLGTLPGFPQTIEKIDPDLDPPLEDWSQMTAPTLDKYIHHLLLWHSTALGLADFFPSGTGDEYSFTIFQSDGSNLYDQVDRKAHNFCPDYEFNCNSLGQLSVVPDLLLLPVADRPATVQWTYLEQRWNDLRVDYQRAPKVHTTRGSALLTATDWIIVGGEKTVATAFSVAPGTTPSQGTIEVVKGEQLAVSQAALNDCTGQRHARANARNGKIRISVASGGDPGIDPALPAWVVLQVTVATAAQRGWAFESTRCKLHEIDLKYRSDERGLLVDATVVLEVETSGRPGLTEIREDALPVGVDPVPDPGFVPPDYGLVEGQQLVALFDVVAEFPLYRTADFQTPSGSGGPTWERLDLGITDGIVHGFVVDPFSPGYIDGAGPVNGWLTTEAAIYRVEDIFGTTPTATAVHTFAYAITTVDRYMTRTIQASFGDYFGGGGGVNPWLMVVSHYADTSGHPGTWATFSLDAGTTWSTEVQITPYYDSDLSGSGGNDPRVEIGVHLSSKFPGMGYTSAYSGGGSPALAGGYVTYDWGATWGAMAEAIDDPAYPQPHWALMDSANIIVDTVVGPLMPLTSMAAAGPGDNISDGEWKILLAPPANAVRVEVSCSYIHTRVQTHTSGKPAPSFAQTYELGTQIHTGVAESLTFTAATVNGGPSTQNYVVTWTKTSGVDWEGNRDQLASSPPSISTGYSRFRVRTTAATFNWPGESAINTLVHTAVVTEIELADGTIYAPALPLSVLMDPGNRPAGSIHVPWLENDEEQTVYSGKTVRGATLSYAAIKAAGGVLSDVSAIVSAVNYGPHRANFGIRAFDGNAAYMVMGGTGNDASAYSDDDESYIFVSDDYGATWTEIAGPFAPGGGGSWGGLSAAFAADTPDVIYMWGLGLGDPGCIQYTDDFGVTMDDRSGNISADFGVPYGVPGNIIGLCGGPV